MEFLTRSLTEHRLSIQFDEKSLVFSARHPALGSLCMVDGDADVNYTRAFLSIFPALCQSHMTQTRIMREAQYFREAFALTQIAVVDDCRCAKGMYPTLALWRGTDNL